MNKLIALILVVAGVAAAAHGYHLYQDATANINILGLEISASDEETRQQSYLYFGLAVVTLVGALIAYKR
ncbi:MAG: hypothetical protein R2795_21515 [Saprospiraceae bacterium]